MQPSQKQNSTQVTKKCCLRLIILPLVLTAVTGMIVLKFDTYKLISVNILGNSEYNCNGNEGNSKNCSKIIYQVVGLNVNKKYIHDITFVSPEKYSFLYSAYWDERQNEFDNKNGDTPNIRIFGAANHGKSPYLYCIFRTNCSWDSIKMSYKHVQDLHGKEFYGYTMSCAVPKGIKYYPGFRIEVSETPNSICKAVSLEVKRVSSKKYDPINFGICVPPLFGDIKPNNLIEFIELSQMLGAEKIMMYTKNVSQKVEDILRYYGKKGLVEIFRWNLPSVLSKLNEKIWYNGQDIAVQDCLYRNMESMKYIAFNDIDEFIIPHKYPDWSSLIQQYDKSEKISDFRFTTAFFMFEGQNKNLRNTTGKPNVEIYTQRTKAFTAVRSKCIVKPELVYDLGTHEINGRLFKSSETKWVNAEDAFLHHYRICAASCKEQVTDVYAADKYGKELTKRMSKAKEDLTE